ncbi:MAG: hypothetical protein K6C94_05950, partial [Candidatus Gastranaerophilales bacterium]|nr:hypothetical protein [Candidatus Gastranaerophilales bacterium]
RSLFRRFFGLGSLSLTRRPKQKPLFSWGTRSFFFSSKEKKKEWVQKKYIADIEIGKAKTLLIILFLGFLINFKSAGLPRFARNDRRLRYYEKYTSIL